MKHLRTLSAALVLTLTLAHSAFAGDISFPVAPPEPPGRAVLIEPSSTPETNSVTEVALSLLQSVLSLF